MMKMFLVLILGFFSFNVFSQSIEVEEDGIIVKLDLRDDQVDSFTIESDDDDIKILSHSFKYKDNILSSITVSYQLNLAVRYSANSSNPLNAGTYMGASNTTVNKEINISLSKEDDNYLVSRVNSNTVVKNNKSNKNSNSFVDEFFKNMEQSQAKRFR